MIVVVVLVLAALAVLGAVVVLAMGRGGELTLPRPDHAPLDDRFFPGAEPRPFRLPHGLWGYQMDMTDHVIGRLRHALWEREAQVAALELRVHDLQYMLDERNARSDQGSPFEQDAPSDQGSPFDRESPFQQHSPPEQDPPPERDWAPVDFAKDAGAKDDQEEARP
ncbi:hypothetical protein [Actinomadura sp. 9N407]|uniref:hypothetical protein n=1 Tax=Actinomadura sp. 9N407 TaxID=3375154 RepID=UPI0037A0729B